MLKKTSKNVYKKDKKFRYTKQEIKHILYVFRIIADYDSEHLDLTAEQTFRDLSKPIGALNPVCKQQAMQRYEDAKEDGTFPPFHYGSHYSSAGIALHYLIRIEPYTTLAIHQQATTFFFWKGFFFVLIWFAEIVF